MSTFYYKVKGQKMKNKGQNLQQTGYLVCPKLYSALANVDPQLEQNELNIIKKTKLWSLL